MRQYIAAGLLALSLAAPVSASHVKGVPNYKDSVPASPRLMFTYCSEKEQVYVQFYELNASDNKPLETNLFFLNEEKHPFAIYIDGEDRVFYDRNRPADGHIDGVAKLGQHPVGEGPCELLGNLKAKA